MTKIDDNGQIDMLSTLSGYGKNPDEISDIKPPTQKQLDIIKMISNKLGVYQECETRYDAWVFISKFYSEAATK